jgi:DNA modification methylase
MIQTQLIYCGDNLQKLRELPDECVDLIYIDPPFNSNRNYEVFWGDAKEKRAFNDRFGDVEHYIHWMRPRVSELYRVLKKTGSLYYHCDWHAGHYVKVMLDQEFGFNQFINEVVWYYRGAGVPKKARARRHDTIFHYAKKMGKHYFNPDPIRTQYADATVERFSHYIGNVRDGVDYGQQTLNPLGKHPDDVITHIQPIAPSAKERLGYPTQKPPKLLSELIVSASRENDVVLDAFCGCGTTLVAAQSLGRKWIGVDISPTACRLMAKRLQKDCLIKEGSDFWVRDLPKTISELRKYPPFEFENWAVNALNTVIANGHAIANRVKVGDMGIDGRIYPIGADKEKVVGNDLFGGMDRWFPVQVKQQTKDTGKVGRPDIDSFQTAMKRQRREKGFFVAFDFSSDAVREISRANREENLEIIPITVQEILDEEVHYRI